MTPEVERAIAEIHTHFQENDIQIEELPDGGAHVVLNDIELSAKYIPNTTWIGFTIGFQYPRADIYPHFIDNSISRTDGAALGKGFSRNKWNEINCIQVSRRSNHLDPSMDSAATKLAKVIEWINSQ